MHTRTITWTNANDEERTAKFYFTMTKREMTEFEADIEGDNPIDWYVHAEANNDQKLFYKKFKELILMSYGVKSADGEDFDKSDELRKKFVSSGAFDALWDEMVEDDTGQVMRDFVKGILPKKYADAFDEAQLKAKQEAEEKERRDKAIMATSTVET